MNRGQGGRGQQGGGIHRISIPRPVNLGLRGAEAVVGGILAGIIGYYIHPITLTGKLPAKRFIFAEFMASISILLAVLWVLPKTAHKIPWLSDFVLSIGWWVSFALILKAINCGPFFSMPANDDQGFCRNWKAVQAFCLISGVMWFVTGMFGIQFVQQRNRGGGRGGRGGYFV